MLSPRQEFVLNFIETYQLANGKSPTVKEIRVAMGASSDNSALKHIVALEKKGYLQKDDTPRGIKLLESVKQKLHSNTVAVPLIGSIPAGGPVASEANIDSWMQLDASHLDNPSYTFMLKVTGNSMVDAGIFENDILIVDSKKQSRNQDIVVALIDNENTVKRLIEKRGQKSLKAENKEYPDLVPITSLEIQGVVVGLIRTY